MIMPKYVKLIRRVIINEYYDPNISILEQSNSENNIDNKYNDDEFSIQKKKSIKITRLKQSEVICLDYIVDNENENSSHNIVMIKTKSEIKGKNEEIKFITINPRMKKKKKKDEKITEKKNAGKKMGDDNNEAHGKNNL
jgi:hypothetical protein